MIILFILWKTVYVELSAIVIYLANPHTISEHNKIKLTEIEYLFYIFGLLDNNFSDFC